MTSETDVRHDHDHDHDHDHGHHGHTVTVKVNNREVVLHAHEVTGSQIKHAADVPETFKLFGPHGHEIENDQCIEVHEGERFTAISGQDVS